MSNRAGSASPSARRFGHGTRSTGWSTCTIGRATPLRRRCSLRCHTRLSSPGCGGRCPGLRKGSTPSAGALLRQYGGEGSFLPIGEVHPREFADMAELHPGAARKIRGRLEAAHLLTIGLEGWVFPFEEGQARHSVPRTAPLSTASPEKTAEARHTVPSEERNAPLGTESAPYSTTSAPLSTESAPLSTVTIYSIKEEIREIPVNMKREPLPLPGTLQTGAHVRNTPNARRRTGEHDEKATAREGRGQPLKPILLCSGCTGPT